MVLVTGFPFNEDRKRYYMRVNKHQVYEQGNIYVFIEQENNCIHPVGYELLGEAGRLAKVSKQKVCAVLFGNDMSDQAQELIYYGADYVYFFHEGRFQYMSEEILLPLLVELVQLHQPDIFLFGATTYGRALAAGLSGKLETGLTADCTKLLINPEDGLLWQIRPAYEGNMYATIVCRNKRPQMATVRPGVMKTYPKDRTRTGEIIEFTRSEPTPLRIRVIERRETLVNLEVLQRAEIIIAVGMGVAQLRNIEILQNAAKKMGASIGGTRPVIDSGLLPKHQQIGLTGVSVNPKLYIACGISGSIQHLSGIQNVHNIIAINTDADAPIFGVARYGIIDDAMNIVPDLAEKLSVY